MSFSRGILGAALAALTTLIGGEAAYGLWGELSYMFFDGAPLPAEARAIAYGAFWLVQTLVAGGKSAGSKVLNLGRVAALVVGAYFFWSWNAGDASTVWEATMATMPSLSSPSAFVPSVPAEFWKHALMTTGVWMTLGSVLPDYAQRMSSAGRVAKGQIAWLPLLTACTALVASSMAQAPNLALYAVVATAALVTNATANFVGPMTALGGSSPGMGAAFAVSCAIACAAPLVMTWQQTVAAASWAVGVGSLLVAPVAGVMLADYWIMRGRVVDRSQLDANTGPGGVYHYLGGVNLRAIAAFLVGVAPDLISVARGASSLFGGSVSAAAMGADAFLSAYVVNMEYSSMIGFAVSFMAYLLFSVLFTPDSLKIARAEARRMRDEDDALAKELAAAKADPYVDGPSVTKYANAVASTASMATAGGSPKKNGGNREANVNAEPAMMAATSAVATEEPVQAATATPTFFVRGKKSAKNEFIVNSPTNSGGRPEPPDSDGDDVDDEAILTFYRAASDRVDAALRPAMASRADARNNLRMLAKERQIMLEGHVENKLVMSMQEVRYEVMQMNLLIAEAELAAAEIEQDLAEARAFFEAEVEDDVEEIEARLDRDPGTGRLADAVQEAVAERRARFATARRDAVDASGAARDAVAATRNAGEQADNAANELRAEDETRSLLRNWAVAVGTWELPPILDVPMLPMSDEEAAQRSKEDLRRSEYESKVRAERENESIRRREEDARRAAAEADIRRAEEEERRIQSREEERRRSAADEVQRLEALIQSVTDSLQTTKSSMSNTVNLRRAEEDANVEREDQRRDLAAADKARAQTEIKAAEEREAARRAEFERKVDTSAAQEKLRRAEELERREAWDAETAALEEEETKKRADEDAGREASLRKVYAARDNLAVVVDGISRRRSDALLAMRELMEEEARLRAEEDARRAAAERVINQAALDERGVLTAQEDERRSAENLRRMQAADAARERAALEQAKIAEEDARRGDADDAVRAAADDLEALERDVKARRANAENDAEARRRALVDMRESERRRRAVIEQDMAIAAESEARARAEEDARKQAAIDELAQMEATNAALLESEEKRRYEFKAETVRIIQENQRTLNEEEKRRAVAIASMKRALEEEDRRVKSEDDRRARAAADAKRAKETEEKRISDENARRTAADAAMKKSRVAGPTPCSRCASSWRRRLGSARRRTPGEPPPSASSTKPPSTSAACSPRRRTSDGPRRTSDGCKPPTPRANARRWSRPKSPRRMPAAATPTTPSAPRRTTSRRSNATSRPDAPTPRTTRKRAAGRSWTCGSPSAGAAPSSSRTWPSPRNPKLALEPRRMRESKRPSTNSRRWRRPTRLYSNRRRSDGTSSRRRRFESSRRTSAL